MSKRNIHSKNVVGSCPFIKMILDFKEISISTLCFLAALKDNLSKNEYKDIFFYMLNLTEPNISQQDIILQLTTDIQDNKKQNYKKIFQERFFYILCIALSYFRADSFISPIKFVEWALQLKSFTLPVFLIEWYNGSNSENVYINEATKQGTDSEKFFDAYPIIHEIYHLHNEVKDRAAIVKALTEANMATNLQAGWLTKTDTAFQSDDAIKKQVTRMKNSIKKE